MTDDEYLAIKDRASDRFMKLPYVNAVGIGSREKGGRLTGEMAIKVFLTRKIPAEEVPAAELIPSTFEGLPTDVVQMGPGKRRADVFGATLPLPFEDLGTYRPLRGGASISAEGVKSRGSLGCILRDKQDGSAIYALTNHHVVAARDKLSRSRRVAQPSTTAVGFHPTDSIGLVAEGASEPRRDAAVVRLDADVTWIPFVEEIGYLRGWRDITPVEAATATIQVRKRGLATRLTAGIVDTIANQRIDNVLYKNVLFITPKRPPNDTQLYIFGADGDSGSVVVDDENRVIGLFFASDDEDGRGWAFRIGTVLELFRVVDGLDLDVAVASRPEADNANPNDPIEQKIVPHPAGAPEISIAEQLRTRDNAQYKPLLGGSQILAEGIGEANAATLGCVVTDETNLSKAYVLTAYPGISLGGVVPPTTGTNIGQPNAEQSISGCCSNVIGEFAKAAPPATPTTQPRVALVGLENDQKWLGEISRIGLVSGSGNITLSTLAAESPVTVRKCGPGSRLTSGVVVRIPESSGVLPAGVPADAMLIRPHDNPSNLNATVAFSRLLDRGAAIVDEKNQVVGVLFGEVNIPGTNGRVVMHGLATPIETALNGLQMGSVKVAVPITTVIDEVQTVVARVALPDDELRVAGAGLVQPVSAWPEVQAAPGADDIWRSPNGLAVVAAWQRHQQELKDLIDRNRRVATIWHRTGGPALIQAFVRAIRVPAARIPSNVNGLPIHICLDRLSAAFCRYGSAALRTDILNVRSQSPEIAGLTLAEILDPL